MNMKTKKCGVFAALAAVLLLSAALVTSCPESLGLDGFTTPQERTPFTAPEGMGYLQLNIVSEESQGRTVLPSTPSILEYIVVYTNTSTSVATTSPRIAAGSITTPLIVPQATYNVEVRGYTVVNSTTIAAVGSASGVAVGTTGTATVTQHEVSSATGTGTFGWNFTFPTGANSLTSATMTVSQWNGSGGAVPTGATGLVNRDVLTTPSGSNNAVISGFYYVDVTLVKDDHLTQTYREIIHIYDGLTTTWQKNNFANLARNVYVVTYHDARSDGAGTVPGVAHASTLTEPSAPTGISGFSFDGWFRSYTAPDTYADKWTFATDKVMKDLDLYAGWSPATTGGLTIAVSFAFDDVAEKTFTLSSTSASLSQGAASKVVTFTLSNASIFDANSVKWHLVGYTLPAVVTNNTFTIDLANFEELLVPDAELTFTIEGSVSSVPYTATGPFVLTITE